MSEEDDEREELSEEESWVLALDDHPEWRRAWENDTLPEEIASEDGSPMNPRLHLAMHAVVERQLAADNPPGVVAIAQELEKLNVPRHEIRHAIARVVSDEMFAMTKQGRVFDQKRYLRELKKVVQSYQSPSG